MIPYAFIFARGGSKGLPGKNIKLLLGKPLIQYSIDIAYKTSGIKKVFVSTDDNEIAKVARANGAIVITRPIELSQDDSPEWLSWRHAIEWVSAKYGGFDEFLSLPATSPLRTVNDVENAILKKNNTNADVCIAITPASRSPYFNMVKKIDKNFVELVNKPNNIIFHRQDATKVFDITTVVYIANVKFVMTKSNIFDGNVVGVEIPKCRSVDIDDMYDFKFAETILSMENKIL